MSGANHITLLLDAAADGDSRAADELLPLVYAELRRVAESRLRKLPPGQTLQATALVHEAYLKLLGGQDPRFESRAHFFSAAARAMHQILVNQAERKASVKHGGTRTRVSTSNLAAALEAPAADMLALTDALRDMEEAYPRKHELVMLRFFAGLSIPDAAELIGVDQRTARRDWQFARHWLGKRIEGDGALADA